jgi:hypothetical protein
MSRHVSQTRHHFPIINDDINYYNAHRAWLWLMNKHGLLNEQLLHDDIQKLLIRYPQLINVRDQNGDTMLHLVYHKDIF